MRNHCRTRRNQPCIALCDAAAALFGRMRRPRNGNGYTTGIGNSRSNQTAEHPAFAAVRPGQHRGYSADTTTVHPNRRQQDSETEERKQKDCYDGIGKIGKRAANHSECVFSCHLQRCRNSFVPPGDISLSRRLHSGTGKGNADATRHETTASSIQFHWLMGTTCR